MKAKSIIVILLTLLIGFILGMLTSAQIRYHRLNPMRIYFSEDRFREGFYKAIQPDARQKAKIDLVLDKYAKINSVLQYNFRKELEANMKEFRKEVDSTLTKDQIIRLKDMDERRQQMIRHNRNNREYDTLDSKQERRHSHDHGPDMDHRPIPDRDTPNLPDIK